MPADDSTNPELIEFLSQFVSEHKLGLFKKIVRERTRHLTVVLEDLFKSQNASACLRNCDCFGIQDVYIVENRYEFSINDDVALGGAQWLTLHRFHDGDQNTAACIDFLRGAGYRVLATSPRGEGTNLADVDMEPKTALLFGTELEGLSETAMQMADGFVRVPQFGFTESYNISVAVALCLYELIGKLRRSPIDWRLSEDDMVEVHAAWVKQVVGEKLRPLERRFYEEQAEGEMGR